MKQENTTSSKENNQLIKNKLGNYKIDNTINR